MSAADAQTVGGRTINILMVTDYYRPHVGGVERVVHELSRRLVARGHAVTLVTLNTDCAPLRESVEGIEVIRVPCLQLTGMLRAQLTLSLAVWPKLLQLATSRRFDLVHVHGLILPLALPGAFVARAFGLPLVMTAHTGSTEAIGGAVGGLVPAYEQTAGRLLLGLSQRVIAVSRAVAAHVAALGAGRRVTVVPNGVDSRSFRPGVPRAGEPARILFAGRMIFNKGPDVLLEAMPRVLQRFPGTRVDFIGGGPLRAVLNRRASELGIAPQIRFLGDRDDMPELLRSGDLLVRPSLLEGLPLVVLEAMASGLPVVATAVGGTPEIVADGVTGYLVRPRDTAALSARICELLGNAELRQAMGRRGRLLAEREYDWDAVCLRTEKVYAQALAERNSGREAS